MRSVFSMEGPVFEALSKLADIMILNVLFVICCIPVVTIGASLTAMSYVTLKMKDGSEGYIWKSFFKAFKENFRQSTVIWLILLVVAAVLGVDLMFLRQLSANGGGSSWMIMQYLVVAGALIWFVVLLYVFPLQARFYNTIWNTLRNSLLMAAANAPKTLLMLAAVAGAVLLTFWNGNTFVWGIFVWLVAGFAALSLLNSTLQIKLFRQIAGPQESEKEESDPDAWEVPEEITESGTPQADPEAKTQPGTPLADPEKHEEQDKQSS